MGDPSVPSTEMDEKSKRDEDPVSVIDSVHGHRKGKAKLPSSPMQNGGEKSGDSNQQDENSSVAGSTTGHHVNGPKKTIRERYHTVKQQYPDLIRRLDRHRAQTPNSFEWSMGPKNPLVLNATQTPVTNVVRGEKNSTPKDYNEGASMLLPPDVSAVESSVLKLGHSATYPDDLNLERQSLRGVPSDSFGEDFVNSKRRMRRTRGLEYAERAPSRGARSEMGEMGPYTGPYNPYNPYNRYPQQAPYYDPRSFHSSFRDYPDGRRSVGPMHGYFPYNPHAAYADSLSRHRPQSSFDPVLNSRHERPDSRRLVQVGYGAYKAEEDLMQKSDSSSSRRDDEESESDEEMAAIHHQQQLMAHHSVAARFEASAVPPVLAPDENYYFGVIQLPQDKAQTILYKSPPPPGYFNLPPIERAAYLFFFVLYNRYFTPVEEFHNRFNREFFKYSCDGDTPETALYKICKHTQEEFVARRSAFQQRAYEKTQKQLFSDERETPDSRAASASVPQSRLMSTAVSDHGEYDRDEDSDRLSEDSASREPLKFRSAHAFLHFGIGGKMVVVRPESSSVVEIRDVKTLVTETETKRVVEAMEIFHGPLIAGVTPPHSVGLYIQRQIDRIIRSDIYKANPYGGDASDCLLVWQLLKMVVQQQGRVTGPDVSRLLMSDYNGSSIPEGHLSTFAAGKDNALAFQNYMQFLLGGHVDEAVESALKDGLILDAMVLARWVCPQKLEKVDAAFLSQRAEQNPVMTLLSVAHGLPAPILTNPPTDDSGSWRSHAAIILANLSTETAFEMVYNLGRVLARREYHAAADFCFLAVSLLANYDPFQPVALGDDDDAQVRRHITLVHASLPDDDIDSVRCCYGFSIIDLHATEIFEYGVRLAFNGCPVRLTYSCDYQKLRFKYALLLSEYGGFSQDAYRYCVEVAKGIAEKWSDYGREKILQLCDLAERLQYVASADKGEIAWFADMRSFVEHSAIAPPVQPAVEQQHQVYDAGAYHPAALTVDPSSQEKARTLSFGSEAAEWHADHQEPLQMSPIPTSSASSFVPQQQNQPVSSLNQQHSTPSDAYAMSEKQQHHILGQRRSSNHPESASQLIAFPPPLPTANEEHEKLADRVRRISVNDMKQPKAEPTVTHPGYYQVDSGAAAPERMWQQGNAAYERTDGHRGMFMTETESSTESSSVNNSSQEGTPVRKPEPKHSAELSTLLEVPSPSGIDDSVFTSGNESPPFQNVSNADAFSQPIQFLQPYQSEPHYSSGMPNNAGLPPVSSPAAPSVQPTAQADENKLAKPADSSKTHPASGGSHSSGIFGMLKAKIAKAIPTGNEMILPDDKHPSIVWDPVQKKYVGAGVEEEKVTSKPPSAASSALLNGSGKNSNVGLTAARLSGGSRYFNPLNDTSASQGSTTSPAPVLPPMMVPPTFGFIPSTPDDDDAVADSPFSVDTSPQVPTSSAAM